MTTIEQLYRYFINSSGVSTDTRENVKNKLFFALSGESFNGNRFAQEALQKGALLAIIDDNSFKKNEKYFLVDDVLSILQQLALHHRKQFNIPVIGITGTNGKTTTKELIATVLEAKYNITATKGNLNNHIGVPLTLLQINTKTEIAVIEMGANHPGEIKFLSSLTHPTHGIITNIGKAHLEGFGSLEGVIKTKNELYNFLRTYNGTAFVNLDDELLVSLSEKINKVGYGTKKATVIGDIVEQNPYLKVSVTIEEESTTINSKLYGTYNFPNILAAVAVGNHFSVPLNLIKQSLEQYVPKNNRSQQLKTSSNYIILDAYNANPVSLSIAITGFWEAKFNNPFLIIGDMFELGASSTVEHQKIVDLLKEKGFEDIILVGKYFSKSNHPFISFETTEQAAAFLQQKPIKNRTILIKGSRGMKLESLIKFL